MLSNGVGLYQNKGTASGNSLSNMHITGGYKMDDILAYSFGRGGGLEIVYSDPVITNVVIRDNDASSGAGAYLYQSEAIISNVNIRNNSTSEIIESGSDLYGGGLYVLVLVSYQNCRIQTIYVSKM